MRAPVPSLPSLHSPPPPQKKKKQAIDPEYYKSLCQILEHPLEDLGLELTFACEASEFGVVKVGQGSGVVVLCTCSPSQFSQGRGMGW